MSWVVAGITAAGAVKGSIDAKQAKKQQAKNDAFRRASIRYSPWTGLGDPGYQSAGNTNALSGAIGGGLQGASIGLLGKGTGLWGNTAPAAAKPATTASEGVVSPPAPETAMYNPHQAMGYNRSMWT